MSEPTINKMSDERIIETLNELRSLFRDHHKSKFLFSLGYAKKAFEENKQLKKQFKALYDAANAVIEYSFMPEYEDMLSNALSNIDADKIFKTG